MFNTEYWKKRKKINLFLGEYLNFCFVNIINENIIDLSKYFDIYCNLSNSIYKLKAIITHIATINMGHYYALVNIDNIWYEFNDQKVEKIEIIVNKISSVCLLLYENFI